MHPFGTGGACAAGLFRAYLVEQLLDDLHNLVRSRGARISEILMNRGAKLGYRVLFDDLIMKCVLAAQMKSDRGDVWADFQISPRRECARELSGRFGPTPFWQHSCHAWAHQLPTEDDAPFTWLRKMMWSATGATAEPEFDRMTRLCHAYDLTLNQLDALGWYSSPQAGWRGGDVPRTEDDAPGQRDVVQELTRAIRHMPSMRDLGLQTVTFRVVGGAAPSIKRLKLGTSILHGVRRMKNGSHHFMSTSITPNVKGFAMNLPKAGEVLAICGSSARYIQWLGRHSGAMDGDEVLYPPGTITEYCGQIAQLTVSGRRDVPLYLLVERDAPNPHAPVVDDFEFGSLKGSDDLAKIRQAYATRGRVVPKEDVRRY